MAIDVARHLEDSIDARRIEAVVAFVDRLGHVLGRHRRDDRQAARRRRDRDEPGARPQRAERRQVRGAGLSARAGDDQHAAVVALVAVGRSAARSARASTPRVSSSTRGPSSDVDDVARNADVGDDDVAGADFGGRQHQRQLRRRRASPSCRPRSSRRSARASRPTAPTADRSATTGMPEPLTSATTVSISPDSGAFSPVPKIASTISVQSLISEKCSSHAWLSSISTTVRPSRPRISRLIARVAAHVGDAADQEHRHVDAALQQRARDDEAVAAVVAAAAQHRDLPLERDRCGPPRSPRPPGGRRSPSARATECRSPRSSGDRLPASARRSGCAFASSDATTRLPLRATLRRRIALAVR